MWATPPSCIPKQPCAFLIRTATNDNKHDLAALLRDVQAREPSLLTEYALRQRAIDLYLTNVNLPEEARSDPDYDHFNKHREWYWVSIYLMDTKYLFAAHGRKLAAKSFVVMVGGLNDYWQPFFTQLRAHLRSRGVRLSQHLLRASANPHVPLQVQVYLRVLA
jgi:hypothetical protein